MFLTSPFIDQALAQVILLAWHVLIGPQVKRNYLSNTHYFQGSQLRMFCDLLELTTCPGDGASSPGMSEFFQ